MSLGAWVLVAAVVAALALGAGRAVSDGRFRGTHRVRGAEPEAPAGSSGSTGSAGSAGSIAEGAGRTAGTGVASVLLGTAYDERRGERATLLQFSSAFCAPCRATRRVLDDVARQVPGVVHVEVDAEEHLDLVRALGILRTPTTLVLDAVGREVTRAAGAPRPAQVLAALEASL
jgi:thiol-disulfide isomerase/thioredoxin